MTEAQDNLYPYLTLTETADPSTPASNTKRVWLDTDGIIKEMDDAAVVLPLGGALSYQQAFLGADVSMASANTFYDGPTVTLSAGTWLIMGRLFLLDGTGGSGIYALKLWDGTTVATNYQFSGPGVASWMAPAGLQAVVVIASGTPTWKISAASASAGTTAIKAAGNTNISGNIASVITAVKIA